MYIHVKNVYPLAGGQVRSEPKESMFKHPYPYLDKSNSTNGGAFPCFVILLIDFNN